MLALLRNRVRQNTLVVHPLVQQRVFEQILQGAAVVALGHGQLALSGLLRALGELRGAHARPSFHRVVKLLACQHLVVVGVLLIQKLVLTQS